MSHYVGHRPPGITYTAYVHGWGHWRLLVLLHTKRRSQLLQSHKQQSIYSRQQFLQALSVEKVRHGIPRNWLVHIIQHSRVVSDRHFEMFEVSLKHLSEKKVFTTDRYWRNFNIKSYKKFFDEFIEYFLTTLPQIDWALKTSEVIVYREE